MMQEDVKASVRTLTKLLGGTFTSNMTRRNTHLIVPCAAGDKYSAAAKFGVKPVTPDWLVSSALAGANASMCANCSTHADISLDGHACRQGAA